MRTTTRSAAALLVALAACADEGGGGGAAGGGGPDGGSGGGGSGGASGGSGGSGGGGGAPWTPPVDPDDFVQIADDVAFGQSDLYPVVARGRWVVYRTLRNDSNGACFQPRTTDPDCNFDLYAWDRETETTIEVATSLHREERFSFDGTTVLWLDHEDDANDACHPHGELPGDSDCSIGLSLRTLPDGPTRRVPFPTAGLRLVEQAVVDGDRWAAAVTTQNGVDLVVGETDGSERIVASGPDPLFNPSLRGDLLVWVDLAEDGGGGCYGTFADRDCLISVHAVDLASGARLEVGTFEGPQAFLPRACGGGVLLGDLSRDSNLACFSPANDEDCAWDALYVAFPGGAATRLVEDHVRGAVDCDDRFAWLISREDDANRTCWTGAADADCGGQLLGAALDGSVVRQYSTHTGPRFFLTGGDGAPAWVEMDRPCYDAWVGSSCDLAAYTVRTRP